FVTAFTTCPLESAAQALRHSDGRDMIRGARVAGRHGKAAAHDQRNQSRQSGRQERHPMTEALRPNQRLGSRGMTGVSLMFALFFMTATAAAPGDWRDEQWVDMDTGQLIGTDRLSSNPRDAMQIVVNATCSESPSRRALSCYFVRLSVEIDAKTKQC